ncbi:tripartite tricarboxylate transporter substrate binding protein [Bordetella sp. BOR01]|uniref:Bug family tripartite tricarboxylate transporter substrate binding protein n=1 Tax=Bordetella sp. BOR01 TaxID=2854779 RepID=UPI001C4481F5|nr:tripartite tricarboxylate transporter substrate binding protein [Bordetella sp. BOR01]MBV7482380.1 tripartite tricarboxylate transporter substrate binding protein [Bordetella sp. BOR01]
MWNVLTRALRRALRTTCAVSASASALALALVLPAQAQYPQQPIRLLVPASPGGTTDIAARLLADPLGQRLGQPVIVENRPGASGSIATQAVARSPADGYTLLFQNSSFHVITPQITPNTPWDPKKDFQAVAHVMLAPQVVVVNADLPIHSLKELVEYDRKHPGKLNYASSGIGSMQHVGAELLNQMAGTKFIHIPYKGTGVALTDLLSGAVDFTITTPPPLLGYLQQGKLRALAVTSQERLPSLPDVPTVAQAGMPDLQASSWLAVYAPAGTPPDVVDKLSKAIGEVVATSEFKTKADTLGAQAVYMDSQALSAYTLSEYDRWGAIVKSAGIRME